MTYLLIHFQVLDMVTYFNEGHEEVTYKKVDLDFMPLLLFTSLLCSSDVVAAVSIVNYNDQPKLYSCIFGEGVVNDIVSIILFNTVKGLQGKSFEWYTVFVVMAQFIMLGFVSITMGIIFGFC